MRRTARSVSFYIIAAIALVTAFAYLPSSLKDGMQSVPDLSFATSSRIASMLVLVIGLYASVCVTHDVQERFLSVAVASGNSCFSVVLAEMLGFSATVFACIVVPSLLLFATASLSPGLAHCGAVLGVKTIVWLLAYSTVCATAFSIVLPLCLVVKSEGTSCIVNLIAILGFWSVTEALLQSGGEGLLLPFPARAFPFTQLFLMCALDPGMPGFWGGTFLAIISAVCFAAIMLLVSSFIFGKMEKK